MEKNVEETSDVRVQVRERYGRIAAEFGVGASAAAASCCGPADSAASCCGPEQSDNVVQLSQIYEAGDVYQLPTEVTGLSLGCGDPITLAALQPGQTVLDLGAGGGIDCFLAAQRVGQTGRVIGVDMTPAMIEKARANKAKIGADNVEFRLGEIEHMPVADTSVDVIISNCVINLSPDKPQVFREAYRVLRPGGKLAVADMVTQGQLPDEIRDSLNAWIGCVAGAMDINDYVAAIRDAGFEDISYTPVYIDDEMIDEAAKQLGITEASVGEGESMRKRVFSAKVSARKPS